MLLAYKLTQLGEEKSEFLHKRAHTQPAVGADMLPWRGCVCLHVCFGP